MKKILPLFKTHFVLFLMVAIFLPLLSRNPYSTRTLIPNLEPFPDALYYTTPPRCFLKGMEWKMCRLYDSSIEGISTVVPPAYSILLLPGYFLQNDVRTFYFTNILLALTSLILLYKVAQNFFKNQYITSIILFFYVTNYFTYWYPTLAMAENLLNPLFLLSILLLQQKKISLKICVIIGLVSASFYATKFAFAPLTVTLPLLFIIKILFSLEPKEIKIKQIIAVVLPAVIILLNLVGFQQLMSVINQILNGAIDKSSSETIISGGSYFSINYFKKNIFEYFKSLIGLPQRFLWDNTPLLSQWIALPGLLGLLISLIQKKYGIVKIWLFVATISQLLFMSTFYVVDIRYVFHFLPILLLGFGFFLQHLQNTILKNINYFYSFLFVIFIIYLIPNTLRLKSAVMVNLKYSETPWWYLSQLDMNKFFDNLENKNKKPILITLAAPFMTDNYSNHTYIPLPLNDQQDFKGSAHEVWGNNDYSDYINLYKEKINSGHDVYMTNYGVNAAGHFKESYENIENNFRLLLIQSGCYNLCNIYRLEIKE